MDIVIYTNKDTLLHKQGIGEPQICDMFYWKFKKFPKRVEEFDNVYFAVQGAVIGSFEIEFVDKNKKEIEWSKRTWKELEKKKPIESFRGFRYKWW